MTSKQRIETILSGGCPDRPGTFDRILNDEIIRHFGGGELDLDNPKPILHQALSQALDATRLSIDYPQSPGEQLLPNGVHVQRQRWTTWYEWPIRSVQDAAEHVRGQIEHTRNTPADLQPGIDLFEQVRADLSDMFLFANFGLKTGIMLYSQLGLEYFSYLLADEPDLLRDYYDAMTDRTVRAIEAHDFPPSISAVFDCEDIAYRGGLLLSADYLRKEFLPRFERLVAAWHAKNIKLVFHSDGNVLEILPDLVACGIDGLNPIETQAGLDIAEIRRIAPDLILIGGGDCSQILPHGTPDEVRKETRRVLQAAGPASMIGSSSEVHDQVPLENYLTMLDAAHEWRWQAP